VKKVLLLVSALLIVFSGVAAVSAYEGHLVNVKAHVENAIGVETYHLDFGTVFPQEKLENQLWIGLSQSFRDQDRYSTVLYEVYWEPKPIPADLIGKVCDPDGDNYYQPIWDYIELQIEGDIVYNPPITDARTGLPMAAKGQLYLKDDQCDLLHLWINPPVFDPYYNELTDPAKPSGILYYPDDYCLVTENLTCGDYWFETDVPHVDLGGDLKIQVMDIVPE
jgi:hypothetical protein